MPKANKLPSGNWRARVYSHTSADGKKHYESFTAGTKQEAEMLAAKFAKDNDRKRTANLTVKEAMQGYIDANKNTLSPTTIYGYTKDAQRIDIIGNVRIRKISSSDVQALISNLVEKGLSPKTIKNTYGTLRSALVFYGIEKRFMVHLPAERKKPLKSPENCHIKALYESANPKLKKAILLGCLSLRRGEICALKYGDIQGNTIFVHADMVKGISDEWIYKEVPKTAASYRMIYLPDFLLDMIGSGHPDEFIIDLKPSGISSEYRRLRLKLGLNITFHQLRHYFASIAKVLDIPDNYAANLGGWRNGSKVLQDVYQNNIVSMNEIYAHKINKHLEGLTQSMPQNTPRPNKKAANP